jgi:hypothetical protein
MVGVSVGVELEDLLGAKDGPSDGCEVGCVFGEAYGCTVGENVAHTLDSHTPSWQSLSTRQVLSMPHPWQTPPQSKSVSFLFNKPSSQELSVGDKVGDADGLGVASTVGGSVMMTISSLSTTTVASAPTILFETASVAISAAKFSLSTTTSMM